MSNSGQLTVAVGMSGGVDSSIVAHLMKAAGHRVVGLTMQIWDGSIPLKEDGFSGCFGPGESRDIAAAKDVAARLGIPHHVIPLAPEYGAQVLDYFRSEYRSGRTPNPCALCNRNMKFGLLLERASAMGVTFDRFATGHYARIGHDAPTGRWLLRRSCDDAKDQTYFLSRLTQSQLSRTLFPLGGMTKPEVKALAHELGWPDLATKQESQNFIESRNYDVLFEANDSTEGPIVDTQGNVIGRHRGIIHYTVGQRKGLGLSGTGDPLYVLRLDACGNTVVVGPHAALFSPVLTAGDLNWISRAGSPERPMRVHAKIRQQHRAAPAMLERHDEATVKVTFDEPQMSVTPGQVVVFYDGDLVLGSGVITG